MRRILENFFDTHEATWEIFMIALAIAFVILSYLPDLVDLSAETFDFLGRVDLGITLFFVLEFGTRITVASSKKVYLKDHWLDLIAIVPAARWLRIARLARVAQLLRIVRIVRVLNSLQRLRGDVKRFVRLNGLQWIILALGAVMLVSSALLYSFEHTVNEKVKSYWDALYAAIVTWTTPGYGDVYPVTANGRILAAKGVPVGKSSFPGKSKRGKFSIV